MASKIQGITVEIGGDTTKLGNALQSVNEKAKSLQSELKGVNTLLKMDPTNVTLLTQKQDILNQSIAECREKLNVLKSTQAQVQEQFEKGEITAETYRDFQREIVATESKLKSLEKQAKSFGSVGAQQIAAVGTKLQNVGSAITDVGKKLIPVSAAASATLVGVTKSAIDFESAFTGVTKTVDGTEEELENIRQGLFKLSETTASSAVDIAAVAEAAGQLGVKTPNILNFTETMVRLGDSTNLAADEAATAIAQLYNVMGSDINTVDRFGASLVALGNNAATTEADILNMSSRIASSGSQIGLTEQQVLALATTLSSVGLEAEGGGSAISAVMTQIDKDVALNTDNLKTWANVAGVSVNDFKNLWENDAMSAIQKVVAGMGDAKAGGENLNVILDDLGVTSLRQTDTMKRLSNASELMADMVNISNAAWDENVALTNESSKRYETTAAKMQQLKNTVAELCSKLGEILLPIIQKIVDGIKGFVNWLSNLNPVVQTVIVVILALTAALAPVLIVVGKVIDSVGSILKHGPQLVSMFGTIKTALSGLFTFIAANPIILVITAIIAAVVLLWNKCEWFRNLVMGLFEGIKNAVITVWNNIKAVWDVVQPYFVALWEGIKASVQPLIEAIMGAFSAIWEFIKTIWDMVQPYFAQVWENIKVIFSVVSEVLGTYFRVAWEVIQAVWDVVVEYFSTIWENIKIVFSVVAEVIGGFFKTAWDVIQNVWNAVVGYFTAIFDSIKLIFSAVTSVLHGDFSGAWEAIKGVVGVWKDYFQNVWNNIKNIFSSVASFFKNSFQAAWNGIKNIFSNVGSFFQNIWNTIKNMFTNIGTTIGNGIGNAFKTVVNSIISFAENTINKFIRAINSAIGLINNIPGVNIGKLKELNIPKLKVGMANVPYDDYLALLHKGERVLTAKENQEYGKQKSGNPTVINNDNGTTLKIENFYNNREQDIEGIAEELEFYKQKYAMAKGG